MLKIKLLVQSIVHLQDISCSQIFLEVVKTKFIYQNNKMESRFITIQLNECIKNQKF